MHYLLHELHLVKYHIVIAKMIVVSTTEIQKIHLFDFLLLEKLVCCPATPAPTIATGNITQAAQKSSVTSSLLFSFVIFYI
jgi:hypothetical protein